MINTVDLVQNVGYAVKDQYTGRRLLQVREELITKQMNDQAGIQIAFGQ
jgi:hypothetical protein